MVWSFLLVRSSHQHKLGAKLFAISEVASIFLFLIVLATARADETDNLTCPQKHLGGEAAQEMMVKGVIMHTQLQSEEKESYTEYTFVHTVRADWTIWICIQAVGVANGKPDNLRLSCTACDY